MTDIEATDGRTLGPQHMPQGTSFRSQKKMSQAMWSHMTSLGDSQHGKNTLQIGFQRTGPSRCQLMVGCGLSGGRSMVGPTTQHLPLAAWYLDLTKRENVVLAYIRAALRGSSVVEATQQPVQQPPKPKHLALGVLPAIVDLALIKPIHSALVVLVSASNLVLEQVCFELRQLVENLLGGLQMHRPLLDLVWLMHLIGFIVGVIWF